jgi:hypothetical protein
MQPLQFFLLLVVVLPASQPFYDRRHLSKVLGAERNYRIVLPPGYETSGTCYPVIYYFHGHSDRYTVEKYDNDADTIPKMADFVAHHDLIVVSVRRCLPHVSSSGGYKVEALGRNPGFICLHDVSQAGLRVTARRWAPDGPVVQAQRISITTAHLYAPGSRLPVDRLQPGDGRHPS